MDERPLGITVICILGWLEAFLIFLVGLALIAFGIFGASLLGSIFGTYLQAGSILNLVSEIAEVLGIVLIVLGILSSVFVYWLWKMQKRGWKWALYSQIFSIVIGILETYLDPTFLLSLIIPVVIATYLNMKKDLFK
jgi:uncharacterized membrane protein YidH (DUF202 family)